MIITRFCVAALKAKHYQAEYHRLEDINMQLLSKLENISMSATAGAIPMTQETSLFAELEVLSHSMSVDSFDNRPAQKITIGTQVIAISNFDFAGVSYARR